MRLMTGKQRVLRVVLAVTLVSMTLPSGCNKQQTATHPPVTYDPNKRSITIPRASILCEGENNYETAVVPSDGMALVVTADSSLYFYTPTQGTLEALTVETSKDAILRLLLSRFSAQSVDGEQVLSTGVKVVDVPDRRLEFTNETARWAAVRRVSASGTPLDSCILAPKTFFSMRLAELLAGHFSDVISINKTDKDTFEYSGSPADSFEIYGGVARLALCQAFGPAVQLVVLGMPQGYLDSLRQSCNIDPDLVGTINTADAADITFFVLDCVLSTFEVNNVVQALDKAFWQSTFSTIKLAMIQAVTGSQTESEFVGDGVSLAMKTFCEAMLAAVSHSAQAPDRGDDRVVASAEPVSLATYSPSRPY
jgi:hypothetical protein